MYRFLAEPLVAQTDDPRFFMMTPDNNLLQSDLADLQLSGPCKCYLSASGITSLSEFVQIGWAEQKRKETFDVRYFNEVILLLEKNDLLYLMEGR